MLTARDTIVQILRRRGEHDLAVAATCCLPPRVDTRRDAIRLRALGLTEDQLRGGCDDA